MVTTVYQIHYTKHLVLLIDRFIQWDLSNTGSWITVKNS